MRRPFKKSLGEIPVEDAHGGSGGRQVLLSKDDTISEHLHAMTKGFLKPGGVFDWHAHENIDEFFYVIKGIGTIEYKDDTKIDFKTGDLIYSPSNISHKIENTGDEDSEFFFIRLDH